VNCLDVMVQGAGVAGRVVAIGTLLCLMFKWIPKTCSADAVRGRGVFAKVALLVPHSLMSGLHVLIEVARLIGRVVAQVALPLPQVQMCGRLQVQPKEVGRRLRDPHSSQRFSILRCSLSRCAFTLLKVSALKSQYLHSSANEGRLFAGLEGVMVGEDQRALEALKELAALKEHVWNTFQD
jgi:hypothetical protein